jgi:hypothetical protein
LWVRSDSWCDGENTYDLSVGPRHDVDDDFEEVLRVKSVACEYCRVVRKLEETGAGEGEKVRYQ